MVKLGAVWDRTAEFLTDNLGAILPVSLIAFLVPFSIQGSLEPLTEGANLELSLVLAAVSIAFGILAVWGSLMLAAMVLDPNGTRPGAVAAQRLLPALLVAIVICVLLVVSILPVVLALRSAGYDADALRAGTLDFPASILWFVCLYILVWLGVLFWVSARLMAINPVIVAEKKSFGAIARSWQLTRGLALKLVGIMLLYILVTMVAILATQLVFGSVFTLIIGASGGKVGLAGVLTSVMVAAVQTGFTVIAPVFTAKLYLALVQRQAATEA